MHMKSQPVSGSNNSHCLYADFERAELFCAACGKYVYALEFDRAVLGVRAMATGIVPSEANGEAAMTVGGLTTKKRKKAWREMTHGELAAAGGHQLPSINSHGVPFGLRGIANLGNTCFLATVLQAVLRTPAVAGFFLQDGHNRELCTAERQQRVAAALRMGSTPVRADEHCLTCELDAIVAGAYSGSSEPLVPSEFLHSWWQQAPEHLAKHRQHDAHEFFLSLVSTLHSNLTPSEQTRPGETSGRGGRKGSGIAIDPMAMVDGLFAGSEDEVGLSEGGQTGSGGSKGDVQVGAKAGGGGESGVESCPCPMHRAFAGVLRSDITCKSCGHTSTVYDPTVGLSLDVPSREGGGISTGGAAITLEGCLRQFARPEQLGMSEAFPCSRCGDVQQAKTKQLAVRRLPPMLTLHLKRFEHVQPKAGGGGGGDNTVGRKIDVHVAFPFVLSMRPYCASYTIKSRYGNRVSPAADVMIDDKYKYDLFAVVVHSGTMDSGHYIAYVQWHGAWFRCDDHQVMRADPATVAAAQAYMLFYSIRTGS